MPTTEPQRVMVAVEEELARTTLVENLIADGYEPLAASSVGHARSRLADRVDALIVDLGAETTRLIDAIREDRELAVDAWLPILAGTASEDLFYPVRLLERGADDVIYEPWFYFEVRARLAALLRRANAGGPREVLRAGALRVDVRSRRAWVAGAEIELPAREFELLRVLVSEPDRVFTREELLRTVWRWDDPAAGLQSTRTLDTHASRLRRRLNVAGESFVRNVWGVGYRLTDTGRAPDRSLTAD